MIDVGQLQLALEDAYRLLVARRRRPRLPGLVHDLVHQCVNSPALFVEDGAKDAHEREREDGDEARGRKRDYRDVGQSSPRSRPSAPRCA